MTTIILDRDRRYGAALAQIAVGSQRREDVTVVLEAEQLPGLLARDPSALVVIDEEAIKSPELLAKIVRQRPAARFVVIISEQRPSALAYLEAGVDALVDRSAALSTLAAATAGVDVGLCALPRPMLRLLLRYVRLTAQSRENEARLGRLSPREYEILEHLAAGHDPARIADRLEVSVHTVRSHLKQIFRKLEVHSSLEAVLIAVGAGMVPGDVDPPF